MKLPYLKFYTRDWQADSGLRLRSFAARGVWIEMLCLMHQAANRGYLEHNGNPLSDSEISTLIGGVNGEVIPLIKELENAGVFSRDERGCIYSRRMVADHQVSERAKIFGAKGGNPSLKNPILKKRRIRENPEPIKLNPCLKAGVNPPFVKPTPSEVEDYAKQIAFSVSGSYFCDFYEARGWMAGKVKMRDWRAAVRTWKQRQGESQKPPRQVSVI